MPADEEGWMEALANINGTQVPLREAKVPALDRGFLFGDAVYEVLRVYHGRPWLLAEHFQRLARSLEAIRIAGVDLPRLRKRMLDTIAAGPFEEAIVYIQITRGVAPRSHPFPAQAMPLEFLYVDEFQDKYVQARETGASVLTLPDIRWDRCDIKSTNLLANVLAMETAVEAGCLEALQYRPDGTLTEGTHTSFFGVWGGAVLTTPSSTAILPGITRGLILRLTAQAGIPVREKRLQRTDLSRVSELFLTGTTSEVLPIVRVDGQPVGDGRPGPITRRIREVYRKAVADFVAAKESRSESDRGDPRI
jgi:D-alanine transaminase